MRRFSIFIARRKARLWPIRLMMVQRPRNGNVSAAFVCGIVNELFLQQKLGNLHSIGGRTFAEIV
jgi:hypothetical protein